MVTEHPPPCTMADYIAYLSCMVRAIRATGQGVLAPGHLLDSVQHYMNIDAQSLHRHVALGTDMLPINQQTVERIHALVRSQVAGSESLWPSLWSQWIASLITLIPRGLTYRGLTNDNPPCSLSLLPGEFALPSSAGLLAELFPHRVVLFLF